MTTTRLALSALLVGAAVIAGAWLARELQVPYSSLRLWLASAHDRIRKENDQ